MRVARFGSRFLDAATVPTQGSAHQEGTCVGEGVGRMLVTQTPGGLYERFFEKVGKAVDGDGGPLVFEDHRDMRRIVEVAAEHGIEIPHRPSRTVAGRSKK